MSHSAPPPPSQGETGGGARRAGGPDEGWYPDPARDRDTFRWWTGTGWTRWLSTDPDADPPAEARSVGLEVARPDPSVRTPNRLRSAAMLVVALAIVLSAAVAIGWERRPAVSLAHPAPSETFDPPVVGTEVDEQTVTINGEVRLDFAAAYEPQEMRELEGVAHSGMDAQHSGGSGDDQWLSAVVFGRAEDYHNDVNVQDTASVIIAELPVLVIEPGATMPEVQDIHWKPRPDLGPDGTAGELTATTAGAVAYELRVVVIHLEHRRRVVYAEAVDPAIDDDGRKALTQTRTSLRRV